METSEVRRRVGETIERSRRQGADEASRQYEQFLDQVAVPLFRQIANVLKIQGYAFSVFTPGGSVRLMSDRNAQDYLEVTLEATGDEPQIVGHVSRARGRRIVESERPVCEGPVGSVTEEDLLHFVLKELPPFVEK